MGIFYIRMNKVASCVNGTPTSLQPGKKMQLKVRVFVVERQENHAQARFNWSIVIAVSTKA